METILKSITFNKSLIWDKRFKDIYLATTVQELLEIFKLRSEVYTQLNYDDEFPDLIQGFNCDSYDENSAILYTKVNGTITGTCRVIFDSQNKLPIDSYFSLDYLRTDMKTLVEVSRLIVKHQTVGLNQEFKWLTKGVYLLTNKNAITQTVSVIKKEHFKLYSKFGGFEMEKELDAYGNLDKSFMITSWNINNISNFFKRAFLEHTKVA